MKDLDYKENWYALFISIIKKKPATDSLIAMGIHTVSSNKERRC